MVKSQSQHLSIVNYVPIAITVTSFMPLSRWELLPGLWIEKIPKKISQKIEQIESQRSLQKNYKPNYAIRIENDKYTKGLTTRLSDEGKTIPEVPENVDPILSDAKHLAALIIISLILQKGFGFYFSNSYSFEKDTSNPKRFTYQWVGTGLNQIQECLRSFLSFFPPRQSPKINRKIFASTIVLLERYFRPFTWSVDRLSVALSSFWNAITANNLAQAYLNLTIMLECLLSTTRNEIAHIIAERAAILLGKSSINRIQIYRDFKLIYSQRSKIVHGNGVPKKGKLTWDSYIISTKLSIVPQSLIKKLIDYAFQLLLIIINNQEIMKVIQSDQKEGTINEELDSIYLNMLMGKR